MQFSLVLVIYINKWKIYSCFSLIRIPTVWDPLVTMRRILKCIRSMVDGFVFRMMNLFVCIHFDLTHHIDRKVCLWLTWIDQDIYEWCQLSLRKLDQQRKWCKPFSMNKIIDDKYQSLWPCQTCMYINLYR
jgi:hypothetical protein